MSNKQHKTGALILGAEWLSETRRVATPAMVLYLLRGRTGAASGQRIINEVNPAVGAVVPGGHCWFG